MKNKGFHEWAVSMLLTLLAWTIVNAYIVKVGILSFILIEIIIAICSLFHTFIFKNKAEKPTPLDNNSDILDKGM